MYACIFYTITTVTVAHKKRQQKQIRRLCGYDLYVWKTVNIATKATWLIHLPINGVTHKSIQRRAIQTMRHEKANKIYTISFYYIFIFLVSGILVYGLYFGINLYQSIYYTFQNRTILTHCMNNNFHILVTGNGQGYYLVSVNLTEPSAV